MSYQDNFNTIKEKINLLQIESVYEQETKFSIKKKQGPCIFCNSGHGTHSSSDGNFAVWKSKNMMHCFACGSSAGVVSLIMHHNRLNFKEAIHYIAKNYFHEELVNPNENINVKVQKREIKKYTKPTDKEEQEELAKKRRTFNYFSKIIKANSTKELAKGYLMSRGIKINLLKDDFYYQAAAYEELPEGVVFFDSEQKLLNKRYLSNDLPEGVGKSFNYGSLTNAVYDCTFVHGDKTVFVVEGVINALSFFSVNKSSIATFGTTNVLSDVEKFRKYFTNKNVVIAMDFDIAGQRAAIQLSKFIQDNFNKKNLKILLFPTIKKNGKNKALDTNDLLQEKTLKLHIDNRLNYIQPTTEYIKSELEKINSNYKFYFPNEEYKNYSYKNRSGKEKNNTHKFIPVNKKNIIKELAAELKYKAETLEKTQINFLESYYIIRDNIKHTFIASKDNPILLLNSDDATIVWRPLAKYPFNEFEYFSNPDFGIIGKSKLLIEIGERRAELDAQIIETADKAERKKLERKKPVQSLFITFNMPDYLKIREIDKEAILLLNDKLDYNYWTDDLKPNIYNIYLLPNNTAEQRLKARAIGLVFIEILIFKLNTEYQTIAEYLTHLEGREHVFFKKLNTALPFKFWEYEGFDVKLNLIAFLNFIQTKGFFLYESQKDKKGYQYIKIEDRIIKSYDDKEMFVKYIRGYVDEWLLDRGEIIKIRNKILTSSELTERNLAQLKQLELDFENSGKNFQNFFFKDGFMWIVRNGKVEIHKQTKVKKHIWEHDLIDYPSKVLPAPYEIFFRESYAKLLTELNSISKEDKRYFQLKKEIRNTSDTKKYDIRINNRNNYFLQFLWLTSYIYWKEAEKNGYEIKREDFWYKLEENKILNSEKIDEMKLHLINKISALGYLTRDYRGNDDDFGVGILDAIDTEADGLKREAAGGGKSIIANALTHIKRIYKAEESASEDFCKSKFRYENFDKQKLILIDDMHKFARLGDILTDFSNGISVNVRHKQSTPLPLSKSPKIMFTRNYIDVEGPRVDRRVLRIYIADYFHDKNVAQYKEAVTPNKMFGFLFFSEETEEQKSDLINFFAYSYISYQKFGKIDSPVAELAKYRIIKQIGEPLIEYMDIFLEQNEENYIDLLWLFGDFKIEFKETFNGFQRTKLYNTTSNFKRLIKLYCEVNELIFNPENLLNRPKEKPVRITKRSTKRFDKNNFGQTAEHIFIATKEQWNEKQNNQEDVKDSDISFLNDKKNDDLPF